MGKNAAERLRPVVEPLEQLLADGRLPPDLAGELRTAADELIRVAEHIIDNLHQRFEAARVEQLKFAQGVVDAHKFHATCIHPAAAAAALSKQN